MQSRARAYPELFDGGEQDSSIVVKHVMDLLTNFRKNCIIYVIKLLIVLSIHPQIFHKFSKEAREHQVPTDF